MTRVAAVLVTFALAGPAAGHDYWLVPETFTPAAGKPVGVALHVGEHFRSESEIRWQPAKTTQLDLVTAAGTTDLFREDGDGTKPAARLTLAKPGTAVLRMDRDWSRIELAADKFDAYLKEEGLEAVRKARKEAGEADKPGRERYRRCLKAIVQCGDAPDDTPTKAVGQVLEIVPEKNPYRLKAGDELPVRVLLNGKPLAGATVAAYHRAGDALTSAAAVTSAEGRVSLQLTESGPWLVRLVHMRRCTDDPTADWESYWAAVTFAVR
ncbi:MAG: DUF4198 domain-containing protein [Gemmataceae bacterium]|nr:DUF4198 domain-containing protein [Gemmataceae bacterium]